MGAKWKRPHLALNWYFFGTLQVRLPFRLQAVVARFIGDRHHSLQFGSVAAANTLDRAAADLAGF